MSRLQLQFRLPRVHTNFSQLTLCYIFFFFCFFGWIKHSINAVLYFFFLFFWVNKTFCSSHSHIFRFTSPSTIIKTQNPSSPSIYSSPLLQWMLWNFKRISRYQWCMPFGISVSYIGRGSASIPIVLFFTVLMVLVVLHLFRLYFSSQF